MRIWWCQEHNASGFNGGRAEFCHLHPFHDEDHEPCRMVPMRLIPDDAPIFNDRVSNRAFQLLDGQRLDMSKGDLAELFARAIYEVNRGLDGETP